jgi:hypothetical protein
MHSRVFQSITVVSLCALIFGCSGSSGDSSPSGTTGSIEPKQAAIATATPSELLSFAQNLLRDRAALQKAGGLAPPEFGSRVEFVPDWGFDNVVATPTSVTPGLTAVPSLQSGTTNQEVGVDEADLLKTDGDKIYALERATWGGSVGDRLHVYQSASDGSLAKPSVLEIPTDSSTSSSLGGMLTVKGSGKLALIGEANSWFPYARCSNRFCPTPAGMPAVIYSEPKTTLQWVDVSTTKPVAKERLVMDGQLVGARQIKNYIYLTIQHRPRLLLDRLPVNASAAELESAIAAIKTRDLLPQVRLSDGAVRPLVSDTDCYFQSANRTTDMAVTVMVAWNVNDRSDRWTSRCFVGGTEAIYVSQENLYLATSRYRTPWVNGAIRYSDQMRTDIHQFAIENGIINYVASGDVAGHLGWDPKRAAYRMSEYQGDLRVLSFTGNQGWSDPADATNKNKPASPATLTVLRPEAGTSRLRAIANLPNANRPAPLGMPGEQIYGVRFEAKRAYLVTFRQTDPLYLLDLSNPVDPRVLGELKMPGYSDYLFPIANDLLLGVGKDATEMGQVQGVRVALMDLRNPTVPKETKVLSFGARGSSSGLDYSPHGINLLQIGNRVRVTLPLNLVASPGLSPSSGLQAMEVDVDKINLEPYRFIPSLASNAGGDIASDRSIQTGEFVFYWSRGQLTSQRW